MQTKVCTKCNRELPISQFQADKKLEFGVSTRYKDCKREYRQANKNKLFVAQDCHVKLDAQRREVDCARHLCPNT